MERHMLIDSVEKMLLESGFLVSSGFGCFDLMAKKDDPMALKVLMNIDSFTHSEAEDLKTLSCFLGMMPLLVGDRANRYRLEESVVYERFGVPTMSPETFECFVNGVMPEIASRRGGYSVSVDPEKLSGAMNMADMSFAELSGASGLSRKTLYKCRSGGAVDGRTCEEISKVFGESLNVAVSVKKEYENSAREPRSCLKKNVSRQLTRMGLAYSFLSRSPFNLVIREGGAIVSVVSHDRKRLESSAGVLQQLEEGFGLSAVFITAHGSGRSIEGIPAISIGEVSRMSSRDEFLRSMDDRQF